MLPLVKKFWIVGLVAVAAIAFFVFRGAESAPETLTVHPTVFVQEVSVSGKVVAGSSVDLGFSTGGRVAHVYTKVGDRVSAGTLLAEVENGDVRAALEVARATLASLKAGTRPEEVAVAEAEVTSTRAALADAERDAYTAAANAITDIDQFISNPRSANPQLIFSTTDSQAKTAVEAGRAAIEPALAAGTVKLDEVATLLARASAALARAIPSGAITQTILDGYIADTATARTSVDAAASSVTSTTAALTAAEKNLTLQRAPATAEDLAIEEARVRKAEADLKKTMIIAPFSGTVTDVDAKVGATLSATAPALSLIGSDLEIESYVPEVNVALIAVGNPAAVTLDAYGAEVTFSATVGSIDPAETLRDGVSTYRSILAFNAPDVRIRAGMTANVRVTTLHKEQVIAIPQGLVVVKDGTKIVRITEDGKTTLERIVTTGALSSKGEIEIVSGLSDGDRVVVKE